MRYIVGVYNQFSLFLFYNIPNNSNLGVLFSTRIWGFLWGVYHAFLLCAYLNLFSFFRKKNILQSWFIDGIIYRPISLSPGIRKMSFALITVGYGAGCCSITVCWSLLFLRVHIIIIIIVFSDLDIYYCCCCTYKLNYWCSVIVLNWQFM